MKENQNPYTKMKKVIDRGKRSKALSEVKLVENISKNLQIFLGVNPVQKKSFHITCKTSLSDIEQECQESLIHGKITFNKI